MTQPNVFQSEATILKLHETPTIREKQFMESDELEACAQQVIDENKIELGPANVCYMTVYPNISVSRAGKCAKSTDVEKHFSGFDYIIQISGELWDMLDNDTRKTLMLYQLLHIEPVFKAKNQEWKFQIRKPDFADFYEINDKIGNTWYKTIQATISSLYDLDPRKEGKVRA